MKTLASLSLTFATVLSTVALSASHAEARIAPEDFEGRYKLTSNRLGMCEPTLLVLATGVDFTDLIISRWRFVRVNTGRVEFDNDFEKGYSESKTTDGNSIVRRWRQYDKINHHTNREDTVATLSNSGTRLHVNSKTGGTFQFETDCTYKRTGGVNTGDDSVVGDIDVGG